MPLAEADIYVDDETGQVADRPALAVALARLDDYTHALFYDATRLARRRRVALDIRDRLSAAGVALHLVLGDTAGMDAESRIWMESIQDAASETEIVRLVRRARMGRRARAERGLHAGHTPIGYRPVRDPQTGRVTAYEFDPATRPILDELARLFLERRPYIEIGPAVGLRDMTVRRVLENPWYRGLAFYGRNRRIETEPVFAPGTHPPAWDQATLAAIDAELARRAALGQSQPRRRSKVYGLFSGILRCGICGRMLVAAFRTHRNKYKSYVCPRNRYIKLGRLVGEPHEPVSISEMKMLRVLRVSMTALTEADVDAFLATARPGPATSPRAVPAVQARLDQLDAQVDELDAALATLGGAARRAVEAERDRATAERDRLAERVTGAAAERGADPAEVRARFMRLAADPSWLDAPPAELRAALLAHLPALHIRAGRIVPPPPEGSV